MGSQLLELQGNASSCLWQERSRPYLMKPHRMDDLSRLACCQRKEYGHCECRNGVCNSEPSVSYLPWNGIISALYREGNAAAADDGAYEYIDGCVGTHAKLFAELVEFRLLHGVQTDGHCCLCHNSNDLIWLILIIWWQRYIKMT